MKRFIFLLTVVLLLTAASTMVVQENKDRPPDKAQLKKAVIPVFASDFQTALQLAQYETFVLQAGDAPPTVSIENDVATISTKPNTKPDLVVPLASKQHLIYIENIAAATGRNTTKANLVIPLQKI